MKCLGCESKDLKKIFDLGNIPPVNSFLEPERSHLEEKFPLSMVLCRACSLMQLEHVVDPDILFKHYQHLSSASNSNIKHLLDVANILKKNQKGLDKNKLLEVGSNDGTLLRHVAAQGFEALGVDPAVNLAEMGNVDGVKTITRFWSSEVSKEIISSYGLFDFVVGLNVFAHSPNFVDMLTGVANVLSDDGLAVFEFAYVFDTLMTGCFDTTYHEHVSCFSLTAFDMALTKAGLKGVKVEKIPTQGGSLRVYAVKNGDVSDCYKDLLAHEKSQEVFEPETYNIVSDNVNYIKENLPKLLEELKNKHGKIIGLGAPARGVVLANACNLDSNLLKYVIDDTTLKVNRFVPGSDVLVKNWNELEKDKAEVFLLFSWNYYDEILKKLKKYVESGYIVVPFPKLELRSF